MHSMHLYAFYAFYAFYAPLCILCTSMHILTNKVDIMNKLTLGVIGTSRKEDEKRVPIHPGHFQRIPKLIRHQLIFEKGYGEPFGIEDSVISALSGGVATRKELLSNLYAVIVAKPVLADLQELRKGGILWGYPHCVQQQPLIQVAIDRKQTLIAFEDMFSWGPGGQIGRHTFYKNNELAGYCANICNMNS